MDLKKKLKVDKKQKQRIDDSTANLMFLPYLLYGGSMWGDTWLH